MPGRPLCRRCVCLARMPPMRCDRLPLRRRPPAATRGSKAVDRAGSRPKRVLLRRQARRVERSSPAATELSERLRREPQLYGAASREPPRAPECSAFGDLAGVDPLFAFPVHALPCILSASLEVLVTRLHLSMRFLALAALLVLVPTATTHMQGQAAQPGAAAPGRVIALRGGTVLTVTNGTIPNGIVVIRDGKIAAVGANVQVPAGAEIVDVTGQFVSPGIIDAHSHIANDAINEGGTTVSSMTGMYDVLDPTDPNIYRDLAGGLTVANVLHGSANPIGGKDQVIKLRWGKTRADEIKFDGAMPGIKFALGEN